MLKNKFLFFWTLKLSFWVELGSQIKFCAIQVLT